MEIERKYLIEKEQLPKNLSDYPFHRIEQGYLCTSPVVRIRRQDDEYFLNAPICAINVSACAFSSCGNAVRTGAVSKLST